MDFLTNLTMLGGIAVAICGLGILIMLIKSFRIPEQGEAFVLTGFGKPRAKFSGAFVVPLVHKCEPIDLRVKTIQISRDGSDGLICNDKIRADCTVTFFIAINSTEENVLNVARNIGCEEASDIEALKELFSSKFADALKTVGGKMNFDDLYSDRQGFTEGIKREIGEELDGYILKNVAIDYLEQTPVSDLNPDNVYDAVGIKVINERTSEQLIRANQIARNKEVEIATQNKDARMKTLAVEQQVAETEATQAKEVAEFQSKAAAETEKTKQAQALVEESARIEREKRTKLAQELSDKEVEVAKIQKLQATEVAEQHREKEVKLAKIEVDTAEADKLKEKLNMLRETEEKKAEKIAAEQRAITVGEVEEAERRRKIAVIQAQEAAEVQQEQKNVEARVKAFHIESEAKAKLNAAELAKQQALLDAEAADAKAVAIQKVGEAEARAKQMLIEAENAISSQIQTVDVVKDLLPLLPQIVDSLMKPANQIDSIRYINMNGMGASTSSNGHSENGQSHGSSNGHFGYMGLLNTIVQTGALIPVMKEMMAVGKEVAPEGTKQLEEMLGKVPGLKNLLSNDESNGHVMLNKAVGKINNMLKEGSVEVSSTPVTPPTRPAKKAAAKPKPAARPASEEDEE